MGTITVTDLFLSIHFCICYTVTRSTYKTNALASITLQKKKKKKKKKKNMLM